jgi:hypothetical protein
MDIFGIFLKIIGRINKTETIYIYLFILSILLGIFHGLVNKNYYKCCESSLEMTEKDNIITIFISNFFLSITNLITAGASSLYLNFHTFSITSSFLNSQNSLIALPFMFTYGFFEMFGVLLFGLAGLSFFEVILRRKTFIKKANLLIYGIIFLLIGATLEIGLYYLFS